MSRSYRIPIRENVRRVLRASDRAATQLERLCVLPPERMAELLAGQPERRGFRDEDGSLVRSQDGVKVTVDPRTGNVTVTAEGDRQFELQKEKEGRAFDDAGASA